MVVVCGLVLAATAAWGADQDAVRLRYKMKEGDRMVYRKTHTMSQEQTVLGRTISSRFSQTETTAFTVKQVEKNGRLHLTAETQRLQIELEAGPQGRYTYDSQSDTPPAEPRDDADQQAAAPPRADGAGQPRGELAAMLDPLYRRLSRATVTVVLSPTGKILDIQGYKDATRDTRRDSAAGSIAAQMAGEDAYKSRLAELFPILPNDAVQPGDTWEHDLADDSTDAATLHGKEIYTLQHIGSRNGDNDNTPKEGKAGRKNLATLGIRHDLTVEINLNTAQARATGRMEIEESSGTATFNIRQGRLVSAEGHYTFAGTLQITTGGQTLAVPTRQKFTTKIERGEK